MKNTLVVIQNDLKQRRFVFVTAAIFAVVPFLAIALVPSWRAQSLAMVSLLGGLLATNFAIAVALGVGISMIGGDLTAGRLSFYFSKPMSAASLWFGKLIAAVITVYAAMAITWLPSLIYARNLRSGAWIEPRLLWRFAVIVIPLLLLLMHVFSVMVRSHSPWIALDAIGIVLTGFATYWILKPLVDAGFLLLGVRIVVAAILIVLAGSGAWHLSRGRTDRVANHRALSKFLWTSIAGVLIAAGGFVFWFVSPAPGSVASARVYASPNGSWAFTTGKASHRSGHPFAFFVNAKDGRFVRVPYDELNSSGAVFSRDGSTVVWMRRVTNEPVDGRRHLPPRGEIYITDLAHDHAARATGIVTDMLASKVLSDDGQRLAVSSFGQLNVTDLKSGRSLGSVQTRGNSMFFVNDDVLRLFNAEIPYPRDTRAVTELPLHILEYDVRAHTMTETGEVVVTARSFFYTVSAAGDRLLIRTEGPRDPADAAFIVDARTGARLATLSSPPPFDHRHMLSADGSLLDIRPHDGRLQLHRTTIDNRVLNDIDLGPGEFGYLSAQNGSHMIVSVTQKNAEPRVRSVVVDIVRNTVTASLPNISAPRWETPFDSDPRTPIPTAPILAATDATGHVVRLDVKTGVTSPLPD